MFYVSPCFAVEISDYNLTLELLKNKYGDYANAKCLLEITYDIDSYKDSGFKYVGTNPPLNVRVTDSNGNVLRHDITKEDEYLIKWHFPYPVYQGKYTVNVEFLQENIIKGDTSINTLFLEWPAKFKFPVHNAYYNIILPENYRPDTMQTIPQTHFSNIDNFGKSKLL